MNVHRSMLPFGAPATELDCMGWGTGRMGRDILDTIYLCHDIRWQISADWVVDWSLAKEGQTHYLKLFLIISSDPILSIDVTLNCDNCH